jgi:hypothetical protein
VEISCKNFVCGGVLVGWRATLENQGSNDAKDSDGDAVTHRSDPVKLAAGEVNSSIDFGFYKPSSCGTGKGNNGVGNGFDPQPPGNPPINDGHGTSPGHPGNKRLGHHRFGGLHKDTKQSGASAHSSVVDWSRNDRNNEPYHDARIGACSSWVKPFVCDFEGESPNKNIKITLSPSKVQEPEPSRGRKH